MDGSACVSIVIGVPGTFSMPRNHQGDWRCLGTGGTQQQQQGQGLGVANGEKKFQKRTRTPTATVAAAAAMLASDTLVAVAIAVAAAMVVVALTVKVGTAAMAAKTRAAAALLRRGRSCGVWVPWHQRDTPLGTDSPNNAAGYTPNLGRPQGDIMGPPRQILACVVSEGGKLVTS